jgi:hypothetical protein
MITTKNKFGLLHSLNDQPSLIDDIGNKYWHKAGKIHRENDQPSIIDNGDLYWYKDGLLHRDNDLPSIIIKSGAKYWHINGVPSRLDISLPYIEVSNGYKEYRLENGGHKTISYLKEEWFDKDGEFHREDGPAITIYYESGNVFIERYFHKGKKTRTSGPSEINYHKIGNIVYEEYTLNNKLHKEDGPARISYYSNGNTENENYFLNNKQHRLNGPALIFKNENGNITYKEYWINGSFYYEKDYLEKIKELKSCNKMSYFFNND